MRKDTKSTERCCQTHVMVLNVFMKSNYYRISNLLKYASSNKKNNNYSIPQNLWGTRPRTPQMLKPLEAQGSYTEWHSVCTGPTHILQHAVHHPWITYNI